jgi:hypothetical protein
MSGGGGYGYGYGSNSVRADELDEWGNTWTWDQQFSTFYDEHNNITGYGAINLGTQRNPLISRKTNTAWQFDKTSKTWWSVDPSTNKRINSKVYPGKAPVPTPPARVVFTVDDPKWARLAVARLGRQRGRVGFGNARAVRILFDKSRGELRHSFIVEVADEFSCRGFCFGC